VSAAYVTSQQDFRDLFSGEFLAPGVSFAMRSITLMFTDIRGSTEMYETLGDGPAYAFVQEHFKLMSDEIRQHEGAIVKTIGDAVMAAFDLNANAVRAALAIQSSFNAHAGHLEGMRAGREPTTAGSSLGGRARGSRGARNLRRARHDDRAGRGAPQRCRETDGTRLGLALTRRGPRRVSDT
jgi:class 3 adenylate cyclase